jgi:serine O-acetyltransferase
MLTGIAWKLHGKRNILARVCYRLTQFLSGCFIDGSTQFANRPCFPHGMHGIFTSGDAVIGKDCVIFQNVTIGRNSLADSEEGAPTIGDYCFIGAGATIVGNITIGNHVRIGANATVYKDVPDNAVVVSGEQRVIVKDAAPDNRFRTMRDGVWVYWKEGEYHPE